jgi:hypothetical protein
MKVVDRQEWYEPINKSTGKVFLEAGLLRNVILLVIGFISIAVDIEVVIAKLAKLAGM